MEVEKRSSGPTGPSGPDGPDGTDRQFSELRGELRQLTDEIRLLRKEMKSSGAQHPALLFLVVITLGFVLAICLANGFHWLLSLGLALGGSLAVFLLFKGGRKKQEKDQP